MKKNKREPLVEALAIGVADKQLAVSTLVEVELAKARIDALEFSVRELSSRGGSYSKELSDAVGVVHRHLWQALCFAYETLYSFAAINEDVMAEVKKIKKEKVKEESDHMYRLSRDWFSDIKESDVRKLVAIKLGYDPKSLGIKDEE